MPELAEARQSDYDFEIADEVKEKIEQAKDLHELIPEDRVRDLEKVDLSHRPYRCVKRVLDFLISLVALLVCVIPMLIIAMVVFIDDPGLPVFAQYRVGRFGKRFKLYKFRTMKRETPKYMSTMEMAEPDRYITKVGRLLRKLSLDELPQLINVLKGDMSLVGPRPLISDEYEIHAMRTRFGVYDIRPGVTGLAQINGRDQVGPEEKVRWDVEYMRHYGPKQDLKILFHTVPKVFKGADVKEGGKAREEERAG